MSPLPFMKRKLNTCAHCPDKTTTVVFDIQGRLYYMCFNHWLLLELLKEQCPLL